MSKKKKTLIKIGEFSTIQIVWEIHYCSVASAGTRFNYAKNTHKRFHFDKLIRRMHTNAYGGATERWICANASERSVFLSIF